MKPSCYFIATSIRSRPVPQHFRALGDHLAKRGHRVVILLDGKKRDLYNHAQNPSIYSWPSLRPVKLRDALFLKGLILKYKPDCLISNFGAVNVMLLVGFLMKVPCRVAWYRTLSTAIEQDYTGSRWRIQMLRLRKKLIYKTATHIATNSEAANKDIQSIFGVSKTKCRVFYNSILDPFQNEIHRHTIKSRDNLICVSRLNPTKGQDILIRAVAMLKHILPHLRVEFVGDGPSKAYYLKLVQDLGVEDKCIFIGSLDHETVLKKMASSIATVVPSRSEAFGHVNIESLAVGTPVIGSNVGGIVEIIRDGVDGFLVPPEDPTSLAEKISIIFRYPSLRKKFSENARNRFINKFERSNNIETQINWFESIVNSSNVII
jgi:glycosyltransferase involved in cell wall biosynthesis